MSLMSVWMESRGIDGALFRELNRVTEDQLMDIDRLVNILCEARETGRTVVVFPDFDMDGVTSGTIMYAGLLQAGVNAHLWVPTYERSHGFFEVDAQSIANRYGAGTLVVTTDTASSSHTGIARAQALGLEVVVTDHHHEPADDLSSLGVLRVNPCRNDETYEHPGICGAAVAFMVIRSLAQRVPEVNPALPILRALAGIGTVADVMPMVHENRLLVRSAVASLRMGIPSTSVYAYSGDTALMKAIESSTLVQIYRSENVHPMVMNVAIGVSAVMTFLKAHKKIRSVYDVDAETIGFYVSPLFNAIRRVEGDMAHGFGVFISGEPLVHLHQLSAYNESRKVMAKEVTHSLLDDDNQPLAPWIYIPSPSVPKGMLGLVAQNLTKAHQHPTLVLSPSSDEKKAWISGSARATGDFNVLEFVREHGGFSAGHAQACGAWFVDEASAKQYVKAMEAIADSIDTSLKADLVVGVGGHVGSVDDADLLALAEGAVSFAPFGHGFEAPSLLFQFYPSQLTFQGMSDGKHTRCVTENGLSLLMWNTNPAVFDGLDDSVLLQLKVRVGVSYFDARARFARASSQVVVDDYVLLKEGR